MTIPRADFPLALPFLVRALEGEREVDAVPVATVRRAADGGFELEGRGRRFDASARWQLGRRAPGVERQDVRRPDLERWDVEMEVRSIGGDAVEAGLVVAVRLGLDEEPRWVVPGLFYGENRPAASGARYPRFAREMGDDPWTSADWGFRVDRAAVPCVFARDRRHGVALATSELGPLGLNGLGFGLVDDGEGAELRLAFPYREEPVGYDGTPDPRPPDRPRHTWLPGAHVTLHFRVYLTSATPYAWAAVLDDVRDALVEAAPLRPWMGAPAAAALAAEGLLRWHAREPTASIAETVAFERPPDGRAAPRDRDAMHVAWLSGAPAAAALLAHGRRIGNASATAFGAAVLDHIAANLAPCGTFWGQWTPERGWTKGWTPGEDRVHARTLGEAALFMLRAATRTENAEAAARWRVAVASNLDYIAATQRMGGAIPASWNASSGEPASWDGCAGLAWVPALVEGAAALAREDLLASARRAGAFYARFVESELLYGAPEDVDLGPTSEDGYVAVMAYVALAEAAATAEERHRWLDLASVAADWMLSFRYAWNVAFDPDTVLGRLDYRTRGMDQASPANQHLHTYGLVALAETIRLGRMTGDRRLVERSREHFAAARQLIARFDGDFGARRGMVPERTFQTACFGRKGEIDPLSHAWCLGLLLWACEQVPELHELAEPDGGLAAAPPEPAQVAP